MKETVNCLREYASIQEALQPAYLIRMGSYLTANSTVFPDIAYDGAVITGHAATLLSKFGLKETSEAAMLAYTTERDAVIVKVEKDYDYIDLVAQGDGAIVAKAGVKGTSTNTASIGLPSAMADLKFTISDTPGQIMISHLFDKLAVGSIYITVTDPLFNIAQTGDTQLTIKTPDGKKILVDVDTTTKTIIKNVEKKSELFCTAVLFNANGVSPVASPDSVVVPR